MRKAIWSSPLQFALTESYKMKKDDGAKHSGLGAGGAAFNIA